MTRPVANALNQARTWRTFRFS